MHFENTEANQHMHTRAVAFVMKYSHQKYKVNN